jgi:protein kinase C substrate 80K-H
LPGFYCKNKGHVPSYLRFESVNDGKCDYDSCCDGSDEWAAVGGTTCPDKCKEIGKEFRKHEEVRQKTLQGALKRRNELITDSQRLRKEVEAKADDLEAKIKAHEVKVKDAETALVEVERREKMRVVRGDAAVKGGGKVGMLVNLAKSRVDELRASLDKTRSQRDFMVARVHELETLLTALKTDYNPNFNDAAVKLAVHGWEDYAARDTADHWTEAEDRDLDAILAEDSESSGVNWSEFSDVDTTDPDVEALYQVTSYLPPALQSWLSSKVSSLRQLLVENGILPGPTTSGIESRAVTDAKKTLSDAERDRDAARNDLTKQREDLEKDYGPDGIFRALKDTCVSKDSGEYTYEVCFLARTQQKPKKGGGHTNMGNFVGFDIEFVDEDIPVDGRGLGRGDRIVLKYEGGQHCWNGPNRSARVVLGCSEREEVWKVSESEKCVYRIEVGTAAVCQAGTGSGNKDARREGERKDEL